MGSGCICGKKKLTRPGEICSIESPGALGLKKKWAFLFISKRSESSGAKFCQISWVITAEFYGKNLNLGGNRLKGTVQRDFLPPIFSQMDFSQAPYSVFKDFSNLASNSRRYSRFLIDSPLLFIAESQYSPYCLERRVATLRFIIAGSHYLLELSA